MKFNLILLYLLFPFFALPQEQLGLRLENYAGASSISLNPAGNLTNPLPWDFNLIGGGLFFGNNYGFVKNTNTLDLLKNANGIELISAKNVDEAIGNNKYIVDYNDDGAKRYFSFNSFVAGPSVAIKIHENHSVGFFTNVRAALGSADIPNEFSFYKYDNRPLFDPFSAQPFDGTFISWSEIGLNYATKVPTNSGFIGFGLNVKRLTGYEAAYLENLQPWVHTKLPDDNIAIGDGYGHYGLTTSNLKSNGYGATPNGKGFGFDIGFLQVIQRTDEGYKWRFGASIIDIGSINFNKNAQAHIVKNPGTFQLDLQDFDAFNYPEDTEAFLRFFSAEALDDSLASYTGDHFKLALPTAVSIQADYSFTKNIFLNGLLVHRLPTGNLSPRREIQLAITPRYEHRWFSVSLPMSLLNWKEARIGLAARLGFLVIGSDKIGSFIGKSDYSGTDIYAAVKINFIDFGWGLFRGGKDGNGKRKFGGGKNVKCYDF